MNKLEKTLAKLLKKGGIKLKGADNKGSGCDNAYERLTYNNRTGKAGRVGWREDDIVAIIKPPVVKGVK